MMRRWMVLLAWLLLASPAWAGYVFDGTNDNITSANDAVAEVDVSTLSLGCWVQVSAQPGGGTQTAVVTHASTISAGNFRRVLAIKPPGTSGWRFQWSSFFGTQNGNWDYQTDLALNTWYHILITYDRSNIANDPIFYINGVAVTATETLAPSGSVQTGDDSIRFGENLGGTDDFSGILAECAAWDRILTATEALRLGQDKWIPSRIATPVYYLPFRLDAVDLRGATGTMTVTGATLGAHPPVRYSAGGGVVMFP